jgi:phosphonatase-like hydrolase
MIKMIVFDMAGTTIDEDNIVYKTVQKAVNEAGIPVSLAEVLEAGAGKEKLQAIKSVLKIKNISDDQLAAQIFEAFRNELDIAYKTNKIAEQKNASGLFKELKNKNIKVVLNTGYSRETAEALIKKTGWQEGIDFDLLVTASDVPNARPYPDMILYAMHALGINDAGEVVKVGDSVVDIEEGQNAGCQYSIGITTGAQTYEQLKKANPSFIINDLREVLSIIDFPGNFK